MTATHSATNGVSAIFGRMFGAGAPNVIAAALLMVSPIIGQAFLSEREYSVWALSATIVTISAVFDLGAPAYVARANATGASTAKSLAVGWAMTLGASLMVGAVATAVWPWYSQRAGSVAGVDDGVAVLFLASAAASGVRGMFVVTSSGLLAQNALRMRGALVLGQAAAQVAVLIVALRAGLGLWALSLAVGSTGAVAWVAGSCYALARVRRARGPISLGEARRFAGWRTVSAIIGMLLTQGDRWAVGLVASPALLGSYDIAARIASIPRVLAINFSVILVVDAVRATGGGHLGRLYRHSVRIVSVAASGATVVALVMVAVLQHHAAFLASLDWQVLGVIAAAYLANACTAPATQLAAGLGRPQIELRYLVPCAVGTGLSWSWGFAVHSPQTMIVGSALALALSSVWFAGRDVPRLLEMDRATA